MAKYAINQKIIFDDELCELTKVDDVEFSHGLGATASRCLKVLLD